MNQDNNIRFGHQGQQSSFQSNPQQFGVGSFDVGPRKKSVFERALGPVIARKLSSPLFATGAFLVAGVAFAALIMAAYPGSSDDVDVPVVQAETMAYKEIPAEPGGMAIPGRDSTIFSAMNGEVGAEGAPIEDLLAGEQSADKLAAFARQVEESAGADKASGEKSESRTLDTSTMAKAESAETEPVTLQKIAKTSETTEEIKIVAATPTTASTAETRPVIAHKPGENPETLEFVRSVLDKKDAQASGSAVASAESVASIQPAAGNPTADFSITPGQHYVQLGSVKSLDGAESEWTRLQKEFSAELSSAQHRVQAAELGERGTFFRIQAGPMSKDSAANICDSIKAQKPGGCLVVQ